MAAEIKCAKCGTINLAETSACRICGQPLGLQTIEVSCPACGYRGNPEGADRCVGCGKSLATLKAMLPKALNGAEEECEHWSEKPKHVARTAWLGVGGIFILLSGVLGIAHALLVILSNFTEEVMSSYEDIIPRSASLNDLLVDHEVVAILMMLFGVLAASMSTFAFTRTRYGGAVAGAVFGIAAIGLVVGSFFALIGLILVVLAKREFMSECG